MEGLFEGLFMVLICYTEKRQGSIQDSMSSLALTRKPYMFDWSI